MQPQLTPTALQGQQAAQAGAAGPQATTIQNQSPWSVYQPYVQALAPYFQSAARQRQATGEPVRATYPPPGGTRSPATAPAEAPAAAPTAPTSMTYDHIATPAPIAGQPAGNAWAGLQQQQQAGAKPQRQGPLLQALGLQA